MAPLAIDEQHHALSLDRQARRVMGRRERVADAERDEGEAHYLPVLPICGSL
jgi:hypothetical protein